MTTEKEQSDIAEVRDQLSLDYADDKYLNIVGNNYGLRRADVDISSLNFDDNTWRALVKVIALQYKQILTKFEQILEIILGPKITQVGTFSADIAAGVENFQVNTDLQFPQVGTLILDEGLPTEETVEVCFIDRYNNIVHLTTLTQFDHQLEDEDAEEPLTLDLLAGDTEVYVPFSENFPTANFPYTLVLGRGTPNEEVVQLTGNDITNNILTISACLNPHNGAFPTQIQNSMSADYVDASYFLSLYNIDAFNESGVVILGASNNAFTATAGTVNDVTCAASTFTANRHVRSRVVFQGNITAALAEVEAEVIINTDTTLTFLTPLAAPPVAGDLFNIRAVLEYVSVSLNDLAINLRRDIVDLDLSINTTVEMLSTETLISLGPVKMVGAGWDVYQVDTPGGPPTVEIMLPEALRDVGELRRASYLHTSYITPVPATTLVGAISAGSDVYPVADNTGFPVAGVVTIDAGGGSEDTMGYSIDVSSTAADIEAGATSVTIDSGGEFFNVPFEVQLDDGINPSEIVTASIVSGNIFTIAATAGPHLKGAEFRAVEYIRSGAAGATPTYVGGESVDLYEPRYAGITLLDGNLWTVDDTWPGPYVYNPTAAGIQQINQGGPLVANTSLNQLMVSGPSKIMISQQAGKSALEFEDASAFPHEPAQLPFSLVIGTGGPNRETIDGNSVALKQRTFALVNGAQAFNAPSLLLNNLDELTALLFTGGASAFPNANGYRVRVGEGTANDEILFVTGVSGGNTITFANNTKNAHANGEIVRLMADVVGTDTLTDNHSGVFSFADREVDVADVGFPANNNGQYFSDTRYSAAEIAQPEYTDLPILSTVGLPVTGSELYLNFGDQRVNATATLTVAASGTFAVPVNSFTCADSTVFPSSADSYPYVVIIEPGTVREEVLEVWDNNTGTGVVTVYKSNPPFPLPEEGAPILLTHPIGSKVIFTPGTEDSFSYQTVSGSDIEFSPADTFNQTFYAGTTVTLSPGLDIPQITGYDFPLIMPSDVEEALQSVLNLVRAAGVLVTFIDQP